MTTPRCSRCWARHCGPRRAPTPSRCSGALTADRASAARIRRTTSPSCDGYDAVRLYQGLGEAFELAAGPLLAGAAPSPGEALDRFVAAHADAEFSTDSGDFRRALTHRLSSMVDPRMAAYWSLSAQLRRPGEPDIGVANAWLTAALLADTFR